ncbi:MAG: phosphotransferase [Microlunatus sp.]
MSWRADAELWAFKQLTARGMQPVGRMLDLSIQPWSAVWRIFTDVGSRHACGTTAGDVVLKQIAPDTPEISTYEFCAEIAPDFIDPLLGADRSTGRMLFRDGGPTLHEDANVGPDSVAALVIDYAHFQQALIGYEARAIAAGIPSWDPTTAPAELESQVQILAAMPPSDIRRITSSQQQALLDELNVYEVAGQILANSALPRTLDHGDLWLGNVLPPDRNGRHRFIDFGNAVWTHPFLSVLPLLHDCYQRWAPRDSPFTLDRADLRLVSSAYLGEWFDYASPRECESAFAAAARLAPLLRSRAAIENFQHAGRNDADELGPTPWTWLTLSAVPHPG